MNEIDFEDLIEQEDTDPYQSGSYLKVSSDHMKSISKVHITLQLITQALIIIIILISYCFLDLLEIDNPDPATHHWNVDTVWIKVYTVLTPAGNKYWYWQSRFDSSITCASEYIHSEGICDLFERTWITNTLLNVSLLVGVTLTTFSMIWTYYQIQGYFHKMNVRASICISLHTAYLMTNSLVTPCCRICSCLYRPSTSLLSLSSTI